MDGEGSDRSDWLIVEVGAQSGNLIGFDKRTGRVVWRSAANDAAGHNGGPVPITVQGVYIAPPDDRRKERFRSHQAKVIHQSADFAPSAELDAFVGQIKEVRA